MKINVGYISRFMAPYAGIADIPELWPKFDNMPVDDEKRMKDFIEEDLYPYFRKWKTVHKQKGKLALSYYLTLAKFDEQEGQRFFDRVLASLLVAFPDPKNPINLFLWIWEVYFPGEEWDLQNIKDFEVVDDLDELRGIIQ